MNLHYPQGFGQDPTQDAMLQFYGKLYTFSRQMSSHVFLKMYEQVSYKYLAIAMPPNPKKRCLT